MSNFENIFVLNLNVTHVSREGIIEFLTYSRNIRTLFEALNEVSDEN